MNTTYTITGMTCEHCVKAITEEVSAIDGVDKVYVSLETGSMTIDSAEEISMDAINKALDEAGEYTATKADSLDTVGHPEGTCACGKNSADACQCGDKHDDCSCDDEKDDCCEHAGEAGADKDCECDCHDEKDGCDCGCGEHKHSVDAAERHAAHGEGECKCGGHHHHDHAADAAEKHAAHGEGECKCGGHH